MFLIVCLSALLVASTVVAQDELHAYPLYSPMPNYDIEKYCGKWFEIARIPNVYQRNHGCTVFENVLNYNRTFSTEIVSLNIMTGRTDVWSVLASPIRGGYPSQFDIYFPPLAVLRETKMTVLATDYVTYNVAAMIQVTENNSFLEYAWILSRTRTLDPTSLNYALSVLRNNNIRLSSLRNVRQDSCPAV